MEVLTAHGPYPSDRSMADRLACRRAMRAAWETYVGSALVCGFFEGDPGQDLKARLLGPDEAGFRSAIAECLGCWFFAGRLGLATTSSPPGRGRKMLDLLVDYGEASFKAEVKSPHKERSGRAWWGDDSDLLERTLDRANKQFSDDGGNVLVFVPALRIPVFRLRDQLVRAFYGEEKIVIPIDPRVGGARGPASSVFFPEGKFLGTRDKKGRLIKPDGTPGFTRVSAVIVIEEKLVEDSDGYWVDHRVVVAHNPFAQCPVSPILWAAYPQLVRQGEDLIWTDGPHFNGTYA
jgi:hypothetical protein